MKQTIFSFLFCFLLTCQNSLGQKAKINIYNPEFKSQLNGWVKSFATFNLSSFKKEELSKFEDIGYMEVEDTVDFYSIYKPALTFSPDKTQFIDIYSYWLNLEKEGKTIVSRGGEVDQAITLCNFSTKKWIRILFRGTNERIQDVIWVTNSEFILVGVREDDLSQGRPIIYLGDTIDKTLISFLSTDNGSIQKKVGYDSPKLLKLKIKER